MREKKILRKQEIKTQKKKRKNILNDKLNLKKLTDRW